MRGLHATSVGFSPMGINEQALKKEETVQKQICAYLRMQYPKVIFLSESAGVRLTIGQAKAAKLMRSESGLPDLIILEPNSEGYHGLCLELKSSLDKVLTQQGKLRQSKHMIKQSEVLRRLREKGYRAVFAGGYEGAKKEIDYYMAGKSIPF